MPELIAPGTVTGPDAPQADHDPASPPRNSSLQSSPTPNPTPEPHDEGSPSPTPPPQEGNREKENPPYQPPEHKSDEDRRWEQESYGSAIAGILDSAGLDGKSLNEYWHKHGSLPEEAYAGLEGQGVSRAVIDQWLAGVGKSQAAAGKEAELAQRERRANDEAAAREVYNSVGGKEVYARMTAWARANFSAEEQEAYNAIMESGSLSAINLAVAGLEARYRKALGADPHLVSGKSGAEDLSVFRSTAEVTQAMSDPRYKSDPAYREDVAQKLLRSDVFKSPR